MQKYKQLYFELQNELDKLDCLRKNWTYFTMKRQVAMNSAAFDRRRVEGVDLEGDTMDVMDVCNRVK